MLTLGVCPRCKGAVVDYALPSSDSPLCLTCGWCHQEVSPAIQAEVQKYLGKSYVEDRYSNKPIGSGKPPLSGWEREKRRRERLRRQLELEEDGQMEQQQLSAG